jgi:hypothetical protein
MMALASIRPGRPRAEVRDAAFEVLLSCVRDGHPGRSTESGIATISERQFLRLAEYHRVAGLAYEALRGAAETPRSLLAELSAEYEDAVANHMRALWGLRLVADVFHNVGCRWAVFKGPVAVEELYGGIPGRRRYLDLDILVEPAALGDSLDQFALAGGRVLDRNWIGMRRTMRGELHIALPGGVPVDLHWNLIDMHRRRMNLDTNAILARSRIADIGGVRVPTLDAVDGTIHLAFHAAYSGGDRLLWLKDVERAAAIWNPDWVELAERAQRANVGRAVGLILERSRRVLRASIPEATGLSLAGGPILRLADALDRVSPWQYGFGRLAAPTRLLSRSIGHGFWGGLTWILWRVIRNLDPWQERRTSTFRQAGDARDREAFIAAVRAAGGGAGRQAEDRLP